MRKNKTPVGLPIRGSKGPRKGQTYNTKGLQICQNPPCPCAILKYNVSKLWRILQEPNSLWAAKPPQLCRICHLLSWSLLLWLKTSALSVLGRDGGRGRKTPTYNDNAHHCTKRAVIKPAHPAPHSCCQEDIRNQRRGVYQTSAGPGFTYGMQPAALLLNIAISIWHPKKTVIKESIQSHTARKETAAT